MVNKKTSGGGVVPMGPARKADRKTRKVIKPRPAKPLNNPKRKK